MGRDSLDVFEKVNKEWRKKHSEWVKKVLDKSPKK